MVDPATISIALTAIIAGVVLLVNGKTITKDMYNNRFSSWGYRIIRFRPEDIEYAGLFQILTSEVVMEMATSTMYVGGKEVTSDVVKCRVKGAPCTVRCRFGIGSDAVIYFIVWDPPIIRRKYGVKYYRKLLKNSCPLVPISTSVLIKR